MEIKKVNYYLFMGPLVLFLSCTTKDTSSSVTKESFIRFEKIIYFKTTLSEQDSTPYKSRLTYYFDNGLPHRWMELDSAGNTQIDYIYEYDSLWHETGGRYKEPGEISYSKEIITFKNDSTKVTEWPDSTGTVFYTMIDNLNKKGKTFRATFIGDTIHGYDSTSYTVQGFEKRIFFTNNKGKIFNDRTFEYDSINTQEDWVIRKKIMQDTIVEMQYRELHYDELFISNSGLFYEGILSTASEYENVISFTENEDLVFITRTTDWEHQKGYLSMKVQGLFTVPEAVPGLDSIYNGAISPKGNKIIYSVRKDNAQEVWLIKKAEDGWSRPISFSVTTGFQGGYFQWFNDNELYLYFDANEGDIAKVELKNNRLKITDSLKSSNTLKATEFSPFMHPNKKYLLFTRYLEGDPSQQGIFINLNKGTENDPQWTLPKKIEALPYGWSAYFLESKNILVYSDGEDIYGVPFTSLDLE